MVPRQDSNPRPMNRKSDALPIAPTRHVMRKGRKERKKCDGMRQKDTEDGEDAEKNDRKGDTDAEGEEKEAGERI